ncbi:MAG: methyltransferase domain-containing protein [Egibacteraceae bacterium]
MSDLDPRSAPDAAWTTCLYSLGIPAANLVASSHIDPARRVYQVGSLLYKVLLSGERPPAGHVRALEPSGEFATLSTAAGIPGVPEAIDFKQTGCCECLVIRHVPGITLEKARLTFGRSLLTTGRLMVLLVRLSLRGISHNDLVPGNIIISASGAVSLIDFDQASRERPVKALLRQILGVRVGSTPLYASLRTILKYLAKQQLSQGPASRARRALSRRRSVPMPTLPPGAGRHLDLLRRAWITAQESAASAPGHFLAYYSLEIDGYTFPGERPWKPRWEVLRSVTDYRGKRVLELGCNLGLLSSHLLAEEGAAAALAVDIDQQILDGARQVAQAFGVSPEFKHQDLDEPEAWEPELEAFRPDIVFALNVMNWVNDKERLAAFLGRFSEVVYEGHGTYGEECERLHSVGFTTTRLVDMSERGRAIIHCLKT